MLKTPIGFPVQILVTQTWTHIVLVELGEKVNCGTKLEPKPELWENNFWMQVQALWSNSTLTYTPSFVLLAMFITSKRIELSIKSPCLEPVFGLAFTLYPFFQWNLQSKEILLNLSMKCWNSASNAQGSRLIIVVVQVGAVKIYVG
jgi:hypothetical protein